MKLGRVAIASFVVCACLTSGHWCYAQDSSAKAADPSGPSQPTSVVPIRAPQANLDKLSTELAELRKKVEKPPKDFWDKLSALSGLASGVIVALIGFYATNVYNRRQKAVEDRRKDQELVIAQIQTVEKFIPHLSSENEQTKGAALVAIAALGNEDLAVKLATVFGGRGATRALTTIASSASPETAKNAARALRDVLTFLKPRVVTIHARDQRRASGLVASAQGLIVTTAHAIADTPATELMVGLPSDVLVPASVVKVDTERDLALLAAKTDQALTPLDLCPSTPAMGESVVALLIGLDAALRVQIGTVSGLVSQPAIPGVVQGERIGVLLNVEPGASGTPVVDREGRLLGLVQAADGKGTTLLIPAGEALAFVEGANVSANKGMQATASGGA